MKLIISEEAKKQIKSVYISNPEKILVFGLKKTGCSGFEYTMELENANTSFITVEDSAIVVGIKKEFVNNFDGTILNYITDRFGSKFVFENPNVKQMCGCGESVSF